MPLTYRVDRQQSIVRSHGTGMLSMTDLLDYFAASRADPDFDPAMHRLMDLREVTGLPSSDDIRSLATFARTKAPVETARMAILASSDLAFGVSMMFKAFVGYGERLVVVRDENEAMAWLTGGRSPD
ncbi:MAG: STAS/SEC14 domain-containing protein [Gemmatimonadaceae bacterium]